MKILIVDDNPVNLRLLRAQLEIERHQVVEARHGVEALRLLQTQDVGGVVSDILMPEMDGFRLCLELRRLPRHAALPFVLCTSTYDSPADRELASSVGADAYLIKPVRVADILHALGAASGRPTTQPPAAAPDDPQQVLRQYNQSLVQKLEEKNAELSAANQQLTYQLHLTRHITDMTAVSIFVTDRQGRVSFMNAHAQTTFGWTFEELRGRRLNEAIGAEGERGATLPAALDDGLAPLPADGALRDHEDTLFRRDGSALPVLWSRAPIHVDGEAAGTVFTVHDMTERKRAEDHIRALNEGLEARVAERTRELQRINHELAATNRELESFSHSASHDLRAPLRGIDGLTELILDEHADSLPPDVRRYLGMVRTSTQRMAALIDDLLRFAKTARQPLNRVPVDLQALVRHCVDEFRAEIERRRIEVRVGPLPTWEADLPLLRQVFANLLDNALKYTRRQSAPLIEIGCSTAEDGRPVIHVKDNGAGFDMRYVDRLFRVFQRLHRQEDFEGTGVGLAIVQRIVQRHGGEIRAEAALGQGATFSFSLGPPP